jgi:transcriptional regulator with XRE-family HTH domain
VRRPDPGWKRPYLLAFGRHLRELREARGLGREELGKTLQSNRSLIRRLEEGMQSASPAMVAKLALALGVSAAELVPSDHQVTLPEAPPEEPGQAPTLAPSRPTRSPIQRARSWPYSKP